MTDFTKIKKRKLEFEPRLLNLNITKISTIINETGLNEIVHIEGVVFDLKEEKVKFKDGRDIRIQECKVKDDTAIIKLTIFGDLIDEVNENFSYKISCLRVAKYEYKRYLKTTENSTVIIQPDLNTELTDVDKKEVENISTNIKVTIQVILADLKSFIPRLFCSNCNEDISLDKEFIICKKCDTMSLTSNCKTDTTVKFTGQIGNDKVLLRVDRLILSEHFWLTLKLELAKAMLGAKLENFYDASKENHVNQNKEIA